MSTTSSATVLQRALLPVILMTSLIATTVYYAGTSTRFLALRAGGDGALVGGGEQRLLKNGPASATVPALAANPLDQQAVNGVIAERASASGDMSRALHEIGLLRQLGWRSNSALQNLLWRAGTTNDVPLMMDTLDALLRREKLLAQIYPILNLMTIDPGFRELLVRRLEARPSWRRYYFMSASDLVKPMEIMGRYDAMQEVQRRGERLTRNEIAPILPKLIAIGQTANAFNLWRTHAGSVSSPLADTRFEAAARAKPDDALPIPFEWTLGSGGGFFVDAGRDAGGSFLSIDWDGRGVPSLVSQTTTARSGRYRLDVTGTPPMGTVSRKIGFRLACANGAMTNLMPVNVGGGARMQLETPTAVRCDYPQLQLFGLVQPSTSTESITLRSIQLVRVGG